jgi:polyhydroxyalkanoate synthase
LQLNYFQQQLALWTRMVAGGGAGAEPVVAPECGDRRFNAAEWRENPAYSLLKQVYLLNSRLINDVAEASDLDEATKHRLRFYACQFVDAMSPVNFAATNP